MTLLCLGDVHVGRTASRVPEPDDPGWSAAAAWDRAVQLALDRGVAAMLVAGDLVDRAASLYESIGPVESGLRRLAEGGVPVYMVAGNHDHDVLARLAGLVGAAPLHWLGRGGQWEEVRLAGEPAVRLHGWSFPRAEVRDDPLLTYPFSAAPDLVTLGLLHGDLDQSDSRYAPFRTGELAARPVDRWVLGHTHQFRSIMADGREVGFYTGSPQALDPGEIGCHGVCLLTVGPGRQVVVEPVPLATVRYEEVAIDLTGVAGQEDWEQAVTAALSERLERILPEAGPLRYVSCRATLTGRTAVCAALEGWSRQLAEKLDLERDAVRLRVERFANATRPDAALEQVARGGDSPAVLARLLAALEAGEEAGGLLDRGLAKVGEVARAAAYTQLHDPPPDRDEVRRRLLREGHRLLAALLDQRGEP